ncbi:MAG: outer membrane protein assembly factor BamA [Deltaproteobacteria bacterium]|nr:outer membrane protein assembly factor BamA [Deltaproteobacteria bacterium]
MRQLVVFTYTFIGILLFFGTLSAWAETYNIGDVQVEGNSRVETSTINAILRVKPGDSVSIEDIDQDIQAIFKLGRFKNVEADLSSKGGIQILTYRVEERPLVRQINFTGNKEIPLETLQSALTFKAPDIYDPVKVKDSLEAVRMRYQAAGYYAAEITSDVHVNDKLEAFVTFKIKEGEIIRIKKISFTGNTVFSDRKLRKVMETKEKWFLSWVFDSGTYNKEIAAFDRERIADQYFNEGYIDIKVSEPKVALSDDREFILLIYDIVEGDQYRTGRVDIQGDMIADKEEILSKVVLEEGDVFSRKKVRESVTAVNDYYADRGYAYVNVTPRTPTNRTNKTVGFLINVQKGVKVAIERIGIRGNTKTRDKVIRREITIAEGDTFNASALKESKRRIHNLGYFEEVSLATSKGSDPSLMNLDIDVKEQPSGAFSFGFGYSSVDNFILQGSLMQTNFLGLGLKSTFAAAIGGSSNTFRIALLDPYFLDTRFSVGFDLFKTEREYNAFTLDSTGGDLKFGFPLDFFDLRSFLVYRFEKKEISDVDDDASFYIREQAGTSTLSAVTASLTRDTLDYRLDPSKGSISTASVEYAGLGGTENFLKYRVNSRHYFPLFWGTVFSINGEIGYLQKTTDEQLPIDEKFFLGGLNSLRGFAVREVGPRDPVTCDFYGGTKEAFFNFDFIFPLIKDIGMKGVVFFDTGNAWEEEDYFSKMRYSVGAGIRWASPMGPLRIEWGFNLDPEEYESNSEIDFSIGRMF